MASFSELASRPLRAKESSGIDWVVDFGRSTALGAVELFGVEPDLETEKWRRDHPNAALLSQFAGMTLPYMGWAKVAGKIPVLGNTLRGIRAAGAATPIRAGAMEEVARFLPFEALRVGATAAQGGDVGETALSGALNLGIGGAVGGIIGAFRGAGPAAVGVREAMPGADLNAPRQYQFRDIGTALKTGKVTPERVADAEATLRNLSREIRMEIPPTGTVRRPGAIGPLEHGNDPKDLNRLFAAPPTGERTRLFRQRMGIAPGAGGFENAAELTDVVKRAGLPDGWEGYVQYPRYVKAVDDKIAAPVAKVIENNMLKLNDEWHWAKEANEGMYVLAKRLSPREHLIFKTDNPGLFAPSQEKWTDLIVKRNAIFSKLDPTNLEEVAGASILNTLTKSMKDFPNKSFMDLAQQEGALAGIGKALERATGKSELTQSVGQFAREYLTPAMDQLRNSPRGAWIMALSRNVFDLAKNRANEVLLGVAKSSSTGNLYKQMVKPLQTSGGLERLVEDLGERELFELFKFANRGMTLDAAKRAGFGAKTMALLESSGKEFGELAREIKTTVEAIGRGHFAPSVEQFLTTLGWKGDWRVPIVNEGKQVIYMASGSNRGEALKLADQMIAQAKAEGKTWLKAEGVQVASKADDVALAAGMNLKSGDTASAAAIRERLLPRKAQAEGPGGYLGEQSPLTKQDVKETLRAHFHRYNTYLAEVVTKERMAPHLEKLADDNATDFRIVNSRLADLAGHQGPAAQWQNRVADSVLGKFLGKNSASKIVKVANDVESNLRLGMGNVLFPLTNAMTFMQTVLPHAAFVMKAPAERLAKYYGWWPVATREGLPAGGAGVFSMWKLLRQSFAELGKPDAELRAGFDRAMRERVIDPQFVEGQIGENSQRVLGFRKVLSGDQGFWGWVKSVSEFLPGVSEKFARGQAFSTGWILGRDMLGLKEEALYRFSKDFTTRTMFAYGTADRARVMTGPMGSLFGLFKNWQLHYINAMMQYTGEAFGKGNWAPLLWMIGGTGAVGGVAALPLAGVADGMSRLFTEKSLMENIYGTFNTDREEASLGDGIFLGLPAWLPGLAGLPNISMTGSVAAPGADPARDASMLFSFVHLDRMMNLGQAAGDAISYWQDTGNHPLQNSQVRDQFIQAFAPKVVARTMQVWEDRALRSLNTGNVLLDDLSMSERVMYAMGFNPRWIELYYRTNDELWRDQASRRSQISSYGQQWLELERKRDGRGLMEMMRETSAKGLPWDSIIQSGKTRERNQEGGDVIDRQYSPEQIAPFRRLGTYQ